MESEVQSANQDKQTENQIIENIGEGPTAKESQFSKIPRLPKNLATQKKPIKDPERPSSANKSVQNLESKYKSYAVKFSKDSKEILTLQEKLVTVRQNMMKCRSELIEKGSKCPPNVPDLPEDFSQRLTSRSPSPNKKRRKLQTTNEGMKNSEYRMDPAALQAIESYMPVFDKTFKSLQSFLDAAHERQTNLEDNLSSYKDDLEEFLKNIGNIQSIKRNSELLLEQLHRMQEEFEKERTLFNKELQAKEGQVKMMRQTMETEISKRQELEEILSKINIEKEEMHVQCQKYMQHIDIMQSLNRGIAEHESYQDLIIQNSQLKYEVDDLRQNLARYQNRSFPLTDENDKIKEDIKQLNKEKETLRNEFAQYCQQVLFEKENRIYAMKNKMDSIVNLKNNLMSRDGKGEHFSALDVIMNINDANSLKNEIVSLYNKLNEEEESRCNFETRLNSKEIVIRDLQVELAARTKTLEKMEAIVASMKEKSQQNAQLLASLDLPNEYISKINTLIGEDNEDRILAQEKWQNMQKEVVAGLEQKLLLCEEKYSLAEDRRIRNEERIEKLQIQLKKFKFFRC